LEKIIARHSTSQQVAKRAKIVLLASLGKNHRDIARELDISRKMARLWRERWQTNKLLNIERQRVRAVRRRSDDWGSFASRAEEMEKQKIVTTISHRHVARLLSEATLKPHQSEYWLNPPPTKSLTKKPKKSVGCTNKHKT